MSDKVYNILKFCSLIVVPIVTFIFLVLTETGVIDGSIATVILSGLDVLVGSIVTAVKSVWGKTNDIKIVKK